MFLDGLSFEEMRLLPCRSVKKFRGRPEKNPPRKENFFNGSLVFFFFYRKIFRNDTATELWYDKSGENAHRI